MKKTIGGSLFVREGLLYDYPFKESILSLVDFCDKVSVVVIDGKDDTVNIVKELASSNKNIILSCFDSELWDLQQGTGKTKLCYFTDIAISMLNTDYNYYQQADEITSELCYDSIRKAVESNEDGYLINRVNLWKSSQTMLNVPQSRLPCSEYVLRLAKTKYRSYGDAESIAAPTASSEYINSIRMYHVGFVRDYRVMKSKIINMQCGVFEMEHYDPKLDKAEIFNPDFWFNPQSDLVPIKEPLPVFIQEWCKERDAINGVII